MGTRFAVATGLGFVLCTLAQSARAEGSRVPAVWYRASEGCPAGGDFVAKLAENGHPVKLADAGDHIDFVVTLLSTDGHTVGRLERQTNGGTVAIRELRDGTCERVAEALALSLGLAVDPSSLVPEPEPEAPSPAPPPSAAEPTTSTPPALPLAAPKEPTSVAPSRAVESRRWSVGLAVGAEYGIATHPLPRGEAFVTLEGLAPRLLPGLSLRGGGVGASGSFDTPLGSVQRTLLAARAEACPVRIGTSFAAIRPCVVSEVGMTRVARGNDGSSALWWAPGAALRGELELGRIRLEASAGALLPVPRHDVASTSAELYRDAIITFSGTLGISLRLP